MFKYLKQFTSLVAMIALLFTFTTESMAAKKSKTLKNTKKSWICEMWCFSRTCWFL
jgi:general L-amino acid transport system substrate-binding protein